MTEGDSPNEETPLLPQRLNNSIEEFMAMYVSTAGTFSLLWYGGAA